MNEKLKELRLVIDANTNLLNVAQNNEKYQRFTEMATNLKLWATSLYNLIILNNTGVSVDFDVNNFTINKEWLNKLGKGDPIESVYFMKYIKPNNIVHKADDIMNSSKGKKIKRKLSLNDYDLINPQNIKDMKRKNIQLGEASKKSKEHTQPKTSEKPKSQQLVRMLSFRIVPTYFKKIEDIADDKNTTVSALIRGYIKDGMLRDMEVKDPEDDFRVE